MATRMTPYVPDPDTTGSDLLPLSSFIDNNIEELLRRIVADVFAFAQEAEKVARGINRDHKREVWDVAAQHRLDKLLRKEGSKHNFDLFLEKPCRDEKPPEKMINRGKYLPHIYRSRQSPIANPDGILEIKGKYIAVELDHGKDLGMWLRQLLKGARSTLSQNIHGLLYLFCTSKDQTKWFMVDNLTPEFGEALSWASTKKPIGILTIGSRELDKATKPLQQEVVSFLKSPPWEFKQ
jgi:hypothetical protein